MKENYFFKHDYNARTDPKLQAVLMEMGLEGIGMYWCIVEQLYEQDGYLAVASIRSIAFNLHAEAADVDRLIKEFGLFENDGERFWSDSVLRRIEDRENLFEKRKAASQKANYARWHGSSETDAKRRNTSSETDNDVISNGTSSESDCLPIKIKIEDKDKIEDKECVYTRTHEEFFERFFRKENQMQLDKMCMDFGTDLKEIKNIALQIINEWTLTEQSHKDYNDASRHLISLIQKRIQSEKKVERKTEEKQNNAQGSWSFEEENEKHRQRMAAKKNCISHEEYLKLKQQGEA